ncbi:MAG: hypothetical protein HY704_01375 [Gemmatimonadetes bacterium]|nr:hypothetical protein [Gemmatimonadota bacterium]
MKRAEIEHLLPAICRRAVRPGSPLFALLEVMQALHEPSEAVLERLDAILDPRRTPDEFVPFLAGWVDLEPLFEVLPARNGRAAGPSVPISTGLGRLRELGVAAAYLSQWRGTAKGLRRFLEVATGVAGFEIEDRVANSDGRPRPFHLRIRAPAVVQRHRRLIERIIELEKPAYVTYELEFPTKDPDRRRRARVIG